MSSYGIEAEIWRPIYFNVRTIEIFQKSDSTTAPVKITEVSLAEAVNIGPTRETENAALGQIILVVLEQIQLLQNRYFQQIKDKLQAQTGSTRLNKSTITFTQMPQIIPFAFEKIPSKDIKFLLENIQFSLDHGLVDKTTTLVPELVTFPVGRQPDHDVYIFKNQAAFLNLFFDFCKLLGSYESDYRIPCLIHWFDPGTWIAQDQNNHPWNYLITLKGDCIFLPKPATARSSTQWGATYPQYNFSIDLTHFLAHAHRNPVLAPPQDHLSDPILYIYGLSKEIFDFSRDDFGHGQNFLLPYHIALLNLSRKIIHNMSHTSAHWTEDTDISRYWIDGAFGFTIWYFLSLCIGGMNDPLYKNLFLLMPKTSPIPFLKAAHNTNPEYYDQLINNFIPAFATAIQQQLAETPFIAKHMNDFLSMKHFFPRIAQWYDAGASHVMLTTPTFATSTSHPYYSNPLPDGLPRNTHELHQTVLFLGDPYLSDRSLEPHIEIRGVLSVLIKMMSIGFMGASTRYQLAITQSRDALPVAMKVIGKLLDISAVNRLPVHAQPGFGRPKLEARMAYSKIPNPAEIDLLITKFHALGKPQLRLPNADFTYENIAESDQQSIDLSVELGGTKRLHDYDDPWTNEEYKFVWIPHQQEFGRRKQDDILRWLEKTQQLSKDIKISVDERHMAQREPINLIGTDEQFTVKQILQSSKYQITLIIDSIADHLTE